MIKQIQRSLLPYLISSLFVLLFFFIIILALSTSEKLYNKIIGMFMRVAVKL